MKRFVLVAALACVVGATALTAMAAPRGTAAESPIVIGRAIGLTGFISAYDGPSKVGADIAAAEINAKGGIMGHPIKFVDTDTKSEVAGGASAATEAIAKGAQILIVTADYDFGGPAARVAGSKGMLAMTPFAESPKFGVQGIGPLAFSLGNGTPGQGAVSAEYMVNQLKLKNLYILTDTTIEYDRTLCSYFKQRAQQLGAKIAGEDTFQNADPSVATQVSRIRSANPDGIYLCSYAPGGPSAIKQIRAAGISVPMMSGSGLAGSYWWSAVGKVTNWYNLGHSSIGGKDPNPKVNAFYKKVAKVTKQPVVVDFSINGYSVVQSIARAIEIASKKAGKFTTDGKALAAALETFRNEPLLVGPTTFTKTSHLDMKRPQAVIYVDNNKETLKGYFAPKSVPPISYK
jgi:branched-chain amino acid transport system substrate-binding protein